MTSLANVYNTKALLIADVRQQARTQLSVLVRARDQLLTGTASKLWSWVELAL